MHEEGYPVRGGVVRATSHLGQKGRSGVADSVKRMLDLGDEEPTPPEPRREDEEEPQNS